ncbi:hypothetical protein CEXT_179021 [Caerostris extrusa]|uniref:Uncharacterized protein n=1 Tax=Caerostris extrusa TaxID=172846 RepID=A0AAV4RZG9_CAEEX|nr:hypothetical protein CEXT_179021 [Caerostris extrusa]
MREVTKKNTFLCIDDPYSCGQYSQHNDLLTLTHRNRVTLGHEQIRPYKNSDIFFRVYGHLNWECGALGTELDRSRSPLSVRVIFWGKRAVGRTLDSNTDATWRWVRVNNRNL